MLSSFGRCKGLISRESKRGKKNPKKHHTKNDQRNEPLERKITPPVQKKCIRNPEPLDELEKSPFERRRRRKEAAQQTNATGYHLLPKTAKTANASHSHSNSLRSTNRRQRQRETRTTPGPKAAYRRQQGEQKKRKKQTTLAHVPRSPRPQRSLPLPHPISDASARCQPPLYLSPRGRNKTFLPCSIYS